jgi:hypothetical protein
MNMPFLSTVLLLGLAAAGCHERIVGVDITPPSAPRGISSAPGDGLIEIYWIENPEPDVAGYNVYASNELEGRYQLLGSTSGTHFVDKNIQNGKTYYYAVSAYDYDGNESALSRDIVYDTPRPEGFNVRLLNYRSVPDKAGYDFSSYSVGPYDDEYTDIFFEYYGGTYYLDVWEDSDIQDMGYTASLYEITQAPTSGWSPSKDVLLILGHTYVVRTWDNHYAKVRITSLEATSVVFDWAYQLQQDNTRLKTVVSGTRKPLAAGPGALSR